MNGFSTEWDGVWVLVAIGLLAAAPRPALAQAERPSPGEWADRTLSVRPILGGDAQWAPDGSRILFRSSLSGSTGLWSVGTDGAPPILLVDGLGGAPFQMAMQPTVSPTGEWVAYVSDRAAPSTAADAPRATDLWLWSLRDGRTVRLTHFDTRIGSISWSPDGRLIAFSAGVHTTYDIFTVTVPQGKLRRVTADPRYETSPVWSPDGGHLLYVRVDDAWVDHEILEIPAQGGKPRLIVADRDFFDYHTAGTPAFGPPLVSPDGRTVAFRSWRSGWINYWVVPREGGEPWAVAPDTWDQRDAAWSPDGSRLTFVTNRNGTHALTVASVDGTPPADLVAPAMGVVSEPRWSPDGRRIAYTFQTPTTAPDLHVASFNNGESRQLTFADPDGSLARDLVTPEKIAYLSDTLTIHAYIYRPPGLAAGEKAPVVMFGHGGPTSQYNDTYSAQMQFFAGQGYVVVAPNFRGGSGYGRAFADLNDGCWSRCDVADFAAGGEYLGNVPYADATRVAVTGTSHGGLIAMGAATHFPGMFRAAIAHGGTADRIYYYETQELRHIKQAENEFGGPLAGNDETYRYVSPFYSVAKVNMPIFVIWGEGRWPGSDNSRRYVRELERHYKTHRAKVYQDENYYVSGRENTRQMLLDMLEFFDQYLRVDVHDATVVEVER